ncbi:MAG: DNA cytosine methyltransferase, partial [Saprospiraceae bacterium]
IDKQAKFTYESNFGEYPFGDIREFTGEQILDEEIDKLIPNHDLIAGGFPCQPFSLAGVSARNALGLTHGFEDTNKGNLFLDIIRIAKIKRPKVLFLENVKNFKSHDKGRTFEYVKSVIENDLGYSFNWTIINSNAVVPQSRKRFYMVCFRDKSEFDFPQFSGSPLPLRSALEKSVDKKYTISDKLWAGHQNRTKRNLSRGTGFTAFVADLDKPSKTLVARYYKDGKECLIPQDGKNPRKLTPRECARLQGFPEKYVIPVSNTAAYKQFGNSVAVPVIRGIAKNIALKENWI